MPTTPNLTLSKDKFDAVIFDMDGVITRTAHVHAAAWKKMFDTFLEDYAARTGTAFKPFDTATDYTRYVDGKPRLDGVRDFLRSRGIELPEGSPADEPQEESIYALGERKNALFNEQLEKKGAKRYDSTVDLINRLKKVGIKAAIISASRNARAVLKSAGVTDLFDARVDGLDAQELGIAGKPAPDVFLAAAEKLGVEPQRAVVVEDAQSGVEAGRAGGFGLVIGVDRADQAEELARFADVVVSDLAEVAVDGATEEASTTELPSALDHFNHIEIRLKGKHPAVFLDYDGTLTPIVERPENAVIPEEMRQTVRDLAKLCTVAIVSGRDLADVRRLAGIEDLIYAGSHGFDIAGPAGKKMEYQSGTDYLPDLDRAEKELSKGLEGLAGVQIERKKFAIAVHFRRVAEGDHPRVEETVDEVLRQNSRLRKTGGKMIFELRPDIDWDKGKALDYLLEKLKLNRRDIVPVYLGDDLTDEDAMRELKDRGIGIIVRDHDEERPTQAAYALEDTCEVRIFLQKLADFLEERALES
ncbi:trehalose-phosphatase [Geoalkalibacter halelectricus]|uniref:Trehalose 6-phosphate phosphatase n=1 Tax=Geoalkalibacter halelectricus TaxID=2847045 RepID=A0ABY5ZH72_9BACT|nr:trehalose-phosphatase [Geoalkalibacter halelectricus]UWZ78510.1 trehalose-phosphatase [Geoalkalibacter halelectricus]